MQPGRNKTFISVLVVLAVAAVLLAVALRPTGADKWEAMTNRIAQLKIETRSRKLPRSALREKLIAGNAWTEYNIALNDTMTWVDDQNGSLFARFANGEPGVDRLKVEQLVAAHAAAIEHLRRGAQRSDGQYPYNWEQGSQMELPSILGSRRLANDAVAQARIWTEKGRPQDAANLLLDVTVYGRDLATNGTLLSSLIGYALYTISFEEFQNLLRSGTLTQKQLADLAQKLETVDHDFPGLSSTLSNETLGFGTSMMETANAGLSAKDWLASVKQGDWRFAMAPRATMLQAFEIKEGYLKRIAKFDELNYAAAKSEADAITGDAETSTNGLVRMSTPSLLRTITVHRETLAQLRLLRAGATYLATGKMPALADPFGGNLLYKQENGKSKIWSVGTEGRPGIVFEIPK